MEDTENMVNVRIPRLLWEAVLLIAAHEGRSGTRQLGVILRTALVAPEPKPIAKDPTDATPP